MHHLCASRVTRVRRATEKSWLGWGRSGSVSSMRSLGSMLIKKRNIAIAAPSVLMCEYAGTVGLITISCLQLVLCLNTKLILFKSLRGLPFQLWVTGVWRIVLAATASCGCPLPTVSEECPFAFRWLSAQWTRFECGALREIEHQMSVQERGLTLRMNQKMSFGASKFDWLRKTWRLSSIINVSSITLSSVKSSLNQREHFTERMGNTRYQKVKQSKREQGRKS
jgi:hypothetical protein